MAAAADRKEQLELLALLEEKRRRESRNFIKTLYPEIGPFRRELYKKHLEFFALGKEYDERAFIAGNRTGKTLCGLYELTNHLTGDYPSWWPGRRFDHPIDAWAAGNTAKTVRDILQAGLIGPPADPTQWGAGMIPGDALLKTSVKHGVADALESIFVRHASGGTSSLQLKSFDQGRSSFQGTSQHVVMLDEDVSQEIYTECRIRLMTTHGMIFWTATVVEGITPLMLDFLPALRPLPDEL